MFTLCGSLGYCFLSLRPSWFVNLLFKMFHLLIKPYLVSHPFVHLSLFFSDVDNHLVSSCHRKTPFTVRSPWKHLCAWHTLASVRLKRRFIVPVTAPPPLSLCLGHSWVFCLSCQPLPTLPWWPLSHPAPQSADVPPGCFSPDGREWCAGWTGFSPPILECLIFT